MTTPTSTQAHSAIEDTFAVLQGSFFVGLGLMLLKKVDLAIGGTAGISILIHYATGWSLGGLFFLVNLPFYVFAYRVFGKMFTIKTFLAVTLLSGITAYLPHLISFERAVPWFAAVCGGVLIGMGLLILIRHRCSLGGLGVLVFYLQERFGWRAGKVQMIADAAIVLAACFVLPPLQVALSAIGIVFLNLVLAINHKPGRYSGF